MASSALVQLFHVFKFTTWPLFPRTARPHYAHVRLHDNQPIQHLDPRFLSFSIDISVLAGGYWWEGSNKSKRGLGLLRIAPLNLNNNKLDHLTAALKPAYLRIGGSEADKIHYFEAPESEANALVLETHTWNELHQFKHRHQLDLVFTVKYGLFKRSQHGSWQHNEITRLFEHCQKHQQSIEVCELGNELNAYWAFHGLSSQPRAHHLAIDYQRFVSVVKDTFPNCKIMGPGSAFWPKLGETIKPFSNITRRFLETCQQTSTAIDIIDWHYYPFQSLRSPVRTRAANPRSMMNPKAFNDFARYSKQLTQWRDEFFPRAVLWTGETGSAQCGGQPKLSDRYISCFWWADQLGQAAKLGHQVVIRQSLIGGDYGMIDRTTLKPRPDFWLSWLWKQLMGNTVYDVQCAHHMVRSYCHSYAHGDGKILMSINLSNKPIQLKVAGLGRLKQQWCVTGKRLKSRKIRINGQKARYNGGAFKLEDFPSLPISTELPGYSINFWLFENH